MATRTIIAVTAIWLMFGLGSIANAQPTFPVRIDLSRMESAQRMHSVTGSLASRRRSTVASEESGLVVTVPFDAGDRVSAGDVLATLDVELLEIDKAEAEAELLRADAEIAEYAALVEQAERDLESIRDMKSRGAAQPKEVADAETDVKAAEARLTRGIRARALVDVRIRRLERRMRGTVIRAPFDGIIVERVAEVGQWVTIGGAIVRLVETGRIDAVLDVPESYVNNVEIGSSLEVRLPALGNSYTGRVRAIVPVAADRARTYPVKVDLDDQGGRLLSGMSVVAAVPSGGMQQALTIHRDSILQSPTGTYVYVIRGDAAFPTNVDVVSGAGADRVVVRGQLEPGAMVVVEGNERLFPSAGVTVTNPPGN